MRHLNLIVKLTSHCNLQCEYCFQNKTVGYQNLEDVFGFLNRIKNDIDSLNLIFHGGEPTLFPIEELTTFLERLTSLSLKISLSLQTNGTLFDSYWKSICLKYNIVVSYSYDGKIDNLRYGKHQPSKHIHELGLPITVLHRYNIRNSISLYEDLRDNLNCNQLTMNLAYKSLDSDMTILPEQYIYYLDLLEYILRDTSPNAKSERNLTIFLNQICGTPSSLCYTHCGMQWLTIETSGYIYPCDRLVSTTTSLHINNIFKLDDVWYSEDYTNHLHTLHNAHITCSSCELSNLCVNKCPLNFSEGNCHLNKLIIYKLLDLITDNLIVNRHYM